MNQAALILILFCALGCKALDKKIIRDSIYPLQTRDSFALADEVVSPVRTEIFIGWRDTNGVWNTGEGWTNDWAVVPFVSTDPSLPLDQWQAVPCVLQMHTNSQATNFLVFTLPVDTAQKFCRVMYQPK